MGQLHFNVVLRLAVLIAEALLSLTNATVGTMGISVHTNETIASD